MALPLFAAKAQPDEIERAAHADQEADQGEICGVEEVIRRPAYAAPEKQA
ncbi:MAG: hypothetical protein RLZ23_1140 [Actinomycetota bacterium]